MLKRYRGGMRRWEAKVKRMDGGGSGRVEAATIVIVRKRFKIRVKKIFLKMFFILIYFIN